MTGKVSSVWPWTPAFAGVTEGNYRGFGGAEYSYFPVHFP
jgi:hypothetical protein